MQFVQCLETEEKGSLQNPKADQIQLRDSNAAYFHALLKKKRDSNAIRCIRQSNGTHQVGSFYQNLFTDSNQDGDWVPIPRKNLSEAQSWLAQLFSEEDVCKIIQSFNPSKALGLDGFNSMFYKTAWHIIKEDLCANVQDS